MANIIGIKFRPRGQVVYGDADYVVVDTNHGQDVAKVVTLTASPRLCKQAVRILGKAETKDLEEAWRNLEQEALSRCKEMAAQLGLEMKPLAARYNSNDEHLTIFFRAPERVDFRNLLWKLSRALETRVELRQTGARDEAKLLGNIGRCGYPLCCQNFLSSFTSVSIKMAKEQNLALNPVKISGICGRLLCCLSYENKEYADMKKKMPQPKQEISTPWGKATVISTNPLKETVTVQLKNEITKELPLDQLIHPKEK